MASEVVWSLVNWLYHYGPVGGAASWQRGGNEAEMLTPAWEGGTRTKGQEQDIPCKDMFLMTTFSVGSLLPVSTIFQ